MVAKRNSHSLWVGIDWMCRYSVLTSLLFHIPFRPKSFVFIRVFIINIHITYYDVLMRPLRWEYAEAKDEVQLILNWGVYNIGCNIFVSLGFLYWTCERRDFGIMIYVTYVYFRGWSIVHCMCSFYWWEGNLGGSSYAAIWSEVKSTLLKYCGDHLALFQHSCVSTNERQEITFPGTSQMSPPCSPHTTLAQRSGLEEALFSAMETHQTSMAPAKLWSKVSSTWPVPTSVTWRALLVLQTLH